MISERVYPQGFFRILRLPRYQHLLSDLRGGASLQQIISIAVAQGVPSERIVLRGQRNLITLAGRQRMAEWSLGKGDPVSHISIGTSQTPADELDEALGSEVYRTPLSSSNALGEGSEGTVVFRGFVPENRANDVTIREGGLWDAASEGTLLARSVLSEAEYVSKTSAGDDIFILEWEIVYSNI